jgi:hypothetical protein
MAEVEFNYNGAKVFDKLDKLLNQIKKIIEKNNKKYEDIAIHLDLTDSEEISIINEFFLSFLITRFYKCDDNIIYIPKDIHIYIEIPNCFEDYLGKFSILKIFNNENITFENMPQFNYPDEIISDFKKYLGINSNEGIQKFVEKYIDAPKYSFHQINIFIKVVLSQLSKFKTKIHFIEKGKDVTFKLIHIIANSAKYFINGGFSRLLTGKTKIDKNHIIDMLSEAYEYDLRSMEFSSPLMLLIPDKKAKDELYFSEKDSNKDKNSLYYLKTLKKIINLPYSEESLLSIIEEKNNNYVITNNNFKIMVLLLYRIIANIPILIMGEPGYGRTSLIKKLNQIVNGGKTTLKKINIHPGITEEKLCKRMKEVYREAEELKKENKDLWIFFDKMNTCVSLPLLTEIFINKTFNGEIISDNIRLIGFYNPYRKRKMNKEKCGLNISDNNDHDYELVNLVYPPLPQSLLYYVFSFGSINENGEKKYIYSIIEKLFTKQEKDLHEITREAISACHLFLRMNYDPSIVSLREIEIFLIYVDFSKIILELKINMNKELIMKKKIN